MRYETILRTPCVLAATAVALGARVDEPGSQTTQTRYWLNKCPGITNFD